MNAQQKVQTILNAYEKLYELDPDKALDWLNKETNKLTEYETQLLERSLPNLGLEATWGV